MGDKNKNGKSSRRSFLSQLLSSTREDLVEQASGSEKIKMLTADGKLVEVDREIVNEATRRFKATNRDIYQWMDNPSKK